MNANDIELKVIGFISGLALGVLALMWRKFPWLDRLEQKALRFVERKLEKP